MSRLYILEDDVELFNIRYDDNLDDFIDFAFNIIEENNELDIPLEVVNNILSLYKEEKDEDYLLSANYADFLAYKKYRVLKDYFLAN